MYFGISVVVCIVCRRIVIVGEESERNRRNSKLGISVSLKRCWV